MFWLSSFYMPGDCLEVITHSHGSASVVRATTQVNGKTRNSTLATPKPLNRSSQKVAHVITSWMSTEMQNLFAIPPGVYFPRMREIAHQKCLLGFFFVGTSNELQPTRLNRFSSVIRQTTRFRARMCLFGVRRQKNIYTP